MLTPLTPTPALLGEFSAHQQLVFDRDSAVTLPRAYQPRIGVDTEETIGDTGETVGDTGDSAGGAGEPAGETGETAKHSRRSYESVLRSSSALRLLTFLQQKIWSLFLAFFIVLAIWLPR